MQFSGVTRQEASISCEQFLFTDSRGTTPDCGFDLYLLNAVLTGIDVRANTQEAL